ncbi:DUF507 family protein [Sulfurospirillum arcachonense]|uniref:DUF507 family protein n=1 Tax=Sulfurospirillum arcachonense TaxID=57666 RepID=UPI000467F2D4|nr:DUF507 family protein [Sulfurospirillum arcachonense]
MKIRLPHAPYIANKIAIDLLNSGFIKLISGLEPVVKASQELIEEDINKEMALEERVDELLDENEDDMEFMQVDRRNMFWLIKKKLAKEYDVVLSYEDRYSALSHKIMELLWKDNLVEYNVTENRVKNIIYGAMEKYIESFQDVEEIVAEKITHYKRKLIPGSPEYDLVFERLYEEELRKKGLLL